MRIGSLFSGIGGLELGLEWAGVGHVVWQVERDEWCRRVLAKHWPDAERFEDVRTARGVHEIDCDMDDDCRCGDVLAPVDLICGGFPCQDVSSAGPRVGLGGARSGLWSEYIRIVRELRPRVVVVENVADLLVRGFDVVAADLAESGYDVEWSCVRACDVGAPHQRERLFIVAYGDGERCQRIAPARLHAGGPRRDDAHGRHRFPPGPSDAGAWRERAVAGHPGPGLRRGVDGFPGGVDTARRLRQLGNAVVPQVAEVVGHVVLEILGRHHVQP